MSFRPPVQLIESAQSERSLSRTEYCLLHHVSEVCAIASYDLQFYSVHVFSLYYIVIHLEAGQYFVGRFQNLDYMHY